jgi:hypothetical protein
MQGNVRLILELALALGCAQGGLWLLARLLGARMRIEAVVAGLALPWIVLAPWIGGNVLLAPTQALAGQVPGTLVPAVLDAHAVELNDAVFQFIPWELEVRRAFSSGRWPFWSDRIDGGSSPWANPQAAVLSPIAMAARALPIQHHLLAALALKILVALQGAWLLARKLGARRPIALLAGVSFALSGAVIAWALFAHSAAAAWAPWCVAATLTLARRRGAPVARLRLSPVRAAILGGTLAFSALLLSGQPEVAAAAGALALLVAWFFAPRRRRGRALLRSVAALSLGAGLAAPVVVPFLSLLPASQRAGEHLGRAAGSEAPASGTAAAERGWFREGKGKMLLAPASPLVYGKPYREPFRGAIAWTISETAYAGLAAFLGCCLLAATRRRSWALPFLGFAGFTLLLAADFRPLTRLWYLLPPLRLPEYARFLPVAALGIVIAGAIGLDALIGSRRRSLPALALAAALASILLAPRAQVAVSWLVLLAGVGLIRRRRWAAALLLGGMLLDLVPWARWMLPRGDPALFYPRTPEVEQVIRETPPAYRALGEDLLSYPSVLPFFAVADPRAHNPLVPNDYLGTLRAAFGFSPTTVEYFSPLRRLDHPFRRFLGVRTIVSNVYLPVPKGAHPLPAVAGSDTRLYQDVEALPRVFAASGVDTLARADVGSWIEAMRDPRRVAVFADQLGDWPLPPRLQEVAVEIVRMDRGAMEWRLPPHGAKLVATSIPGPRGWKARSGSRPLRTLTVDGAFLAVLVPGRIDRVELDYRPPGLDAGLFAALLAVLGLAAVTVAPEAWLRPQRLRQGVLLAVLTGAAAALVLAGKNRLGHLGAPPTAYPRAPHRWAWGTPPPESVRSLVLGSAPFLDRNDCQVGFAGPWAGDEALFPPLWAAYFLPGCDVVPLASPAADGPELRIVAGEPRPAEVGLEVVATLPGGGLYRKQP